jgi:hypothetical protein
MIDKQLVRLEKLLIEISIGILPRFCQGLGSN